MKTVKTAKAIAPKPVRVYTAEEFMKDICPQGVYKDQGNYIGYWITSDIARFHWNPTTGAINTIGTPMANERLVRIDDAKVIFDLQLPNESIFGS